MCPNDIHENGLLLLFIVPSYLLQRFTDVIRIQSFITMSNEISVRCSLSRFYVFLPEPVSVVYGASAVTQLTGWGPHRLDNLVPCNY